MSYCIGVEDLVIEAEGQRIIDNVSFKVECGEYVVVTGPSGGGKSVLLRTISGDAGYLSGLRIKGRVYVNGVNVLEGGVKSIAGTIGVVLQNPVNQVFNLTVEEEVAFPLENMGLDPSDIEERVKWALSLLGVEGLRKKLVSELSMGQLQRVVVASIIAMKPRIMLLDEPCSHMDPVSKKDFYITLGDLWKTLGLTIVVVEHELSHVLGYATKMLLLNKRLIAYGDPIELLSRINIEDYGVKEPPHIKYCRLLKSRLRPISENEVIECLKEVFCRNF